MTNQSEVMTAPAIDDLVPAEAAPQLWNGDAAGTASFPKVLRRRLDSFFADQKISPKANRMMWIKVAAGLAVLAGSWIAIYAFNPVPLAQAVTTEPHLLLVARSLVSQIPADYAFQPIASSPTLELGLISRLP